MEDLLEVGAEQPLYDCESSLLTSVELDEHMSQTMLYSERGGSLQCMHCKMQGTHLVSGEEVISWKEAVDAGLMSPALDYTVFDNGKFADLVHAYEALLDMTSGVASSATAPPPALLEVAAALRAMNDALDALSGCTSRVPRLPLARKVLAVPLPARRAPPPQPPPGTPRLRLQRLRTPLTSEKRAELDAVFSGRIAGVKTAGEKLLLHLIGALSEALQATSPEARDLADLALKTLGRLYTSLRRLNAPATVPPLVVESFVLAPQVAGATARAACDILLHLWATGGLTPSPEAAAWEAQVDTFGRRHFLVEMVDELPPFLTGLAVQAYGRTLPAARGTTLQKLATWNNTIGNLGFGQQRGAGLCGMCSAPFGEAKLAAEGKEGDYTVRARGRCACVPLFRFSLLPLTRAARSPSPVRRAMRTTRRARCRSRACNTSVAMRNMTGATKRQRAAFRLPRSGWQLTTRVRHAARSVSCLAAARWAARAWSASSACTTPSPSPP